MSILVLLHLLGGLKLLCGRPGRMEGGAAARFTRSPLIFETNKHVDGERKKKNHYGPQSKVVRQLRLELDASHTVFCARKRSRDKKKSTLSTRIYRGLQSIAYSNTFQEAKKGLVLVRCMHQQHPSPALLVSYLRQVSYQWEAISSKLSVVSYQ